MVSRKEAVSTIRAHVNAVIIEEQKTQKEKNFAYNEIESKRQDKLKEELMELINARLETIKEEYSVTLYIHKIKKSKIPYLQPVINLHYWITLKDHGTKRLDKIAKESYKLFNNGKITDRDLFAIMKL